MKKLVKALTALSTAIALLNLPVQAVQAAGSAEPVFKLATPREHYDAIAKFDPLTGRGRFFAPADLLPQDSPDRSWIIDPNAGTEFTAPSEQGVYNMCLGDCHKIAPLVVSANPERPTAEMVVIVPDLTWQAYNPNGGGSLYTDFKRHKDGLTHFAFGVSRQHPLGLHALSKVNLNRPLLVTAPNGINQDEVPATNPIQFLRESGYSVDVVSQTALSDYHYDLARYKTIVIYGHDEYWTDQIANQLVDAVRAGSNLLNLSGNTGYRQVLLSDSVMSFPQDSKQTDLSARPLDVTNQVLPLLGERYLEYPIIRHLSDRGLKFTKKVYKKLIQDGFPAQISYRRALRFTAGLKIVKNSSPLLDGVKLDRYGFIGVKTKVINYEVDGVPLDKHFGLSDFALNVLQDKHADILGRAWAGIEHVIANPPFSQVGMLTAKYFGKGRVISVGSMGWMPALLARDRNVLKLTRNFLAALDEPARASESTIEWAMSPELADSTELATLHLGAHEDAEVHITCKAGEAPVDCSTEIVGDRVILKTKKPVDHAEVSVTVLGASGYRILVEPRDLSMAFFKQ